MAKANLGTKRVCPETGRKFYDLEKDPIVSPYTGNEYPLSFFEAETAVVAPKPDESAKPEKEEAKPEAAPEEEVETSVAEDGPEIISLEDAEEDDVDDDADSDDEEIPDIPDIPEVDIDEEDEAADDDKFLESDDDDDDLSDVIVARDDKEEDL